MMGLAQCRGNLPRFQEPLQLEKAGRADIRGFGDEQKEKVQTGMEGYRLTTMTVQAKSRKTRKSPGWLKRLDSVSRALP